MPGYFGVTAADVAAELPGIAPAGGFTASTRPTLADVDRWITRADTRATLAVQRSTGTLPLATDAGYPLGKDYVTEWAKGKVKRAIFEGRRSQDVRAATDYHFIEAKDTLKEIEELGVQITGAIAEGVPSRVRGVTPSPSRQMLVGDEDLNTGTSRKSRW